MAMHEGSFKERDAEEVVLPDKRFDAVLNLLQTLHPPCKELEGAAGAAGGGFGGATGGGFDGAVGGGFGGATGGGFGGFNGGFGSDFWGFNNGESDNRCDDNGDNGGGGTNGEDGDGWQQLAAEWRLYEEGDRSGNEGMEEETEERDEEEEEGRGGEGGEGKGREGRRGGREEEKREKRERRGKRGRRRGGWFVWCGSGVEYKRRMEVPWMRKRLEGFGEEGEKHGVWKDVFERLQKGAIQMHLIISCTQDFSQHFTSH